MKIKNIFNKKIRFNISVVTGVLLIVGIMTFSIVGMILSAAKNSAKDEAAIQFESASRTVREQIISHMQPAIDTAVLFSLVPGIDAKTEGDGLNHPLIKLFSAYLSSRKYFYSSYVGFSDGTFFQIIKAGKNRMIIDAHSAPSETDLIIRTITGEGESRIQTFSFIDSDGYLISKTSETDFDYDPGQRGWYKDALKHEGAILSKPYLFNSLKQPGITAACAVSGGNAVVGIDLTIDSLSSFIASQKISLNGEISLLTDDFELIASSAMENTGFTDHIARNCIESSINIADDNGLLDSGGFFYRKESVQIGASTNWHIITAAPFSDFMTSALELQKKINFITFLVLVLIVPFVVLWSKKLSNALRELAEDADRVGNMVFDGKLKVETPIYEFHQLARGFEVMKSTISDRTEKLKEALEKLEMLVEMGIAMSAEFDINKLSRMILAGAKKLTNADGGSVYLANGERDALDFMIVLNDTLGFCQGGDSGIPVSMRPVPLYDSDGHENHHNVVTHSFHTGKTVNIPDAYEVGKYDFSGTREFDKNNNYRSVSFLTVPLKPRGGGDVLGALQLINAKNTETGEIIPFPPEWESFIEALSSAAAVAVQNWKLMEIQKQLFDDLVKFIACAIDAKSPYTARHCERVPEIASLIMEEADKNNSGLFKNFRLDTPEKKRELNIASWLHDCGKIITPEYVVDKATKLETIYNRIHEIRTRFEVLLRDAQIERLEMIIDGKPSEEAEREYERNARQLQNDFEFIAECNIGSEYMEDEKIERLEKIASRTWLRYFDNRIGLSWGEINRLTPFQKTDKKESCPVEEKLLSDRPDHLIQREKWTQESYEKHGFRFNMPRYLYNRGEIYNLSVRSGTLTAEERFKINEHVAQTIILLENLKFPETLRNIPVFAGRHHELLDGTGYPRNLDFSDLSIPDRILAISDIFEALTSSDRPYKQANTLSQAIEVLYDMKIKGKIDPDLFDLLLTSGAYRKYAERFLDSSQIDEFDIKKYLQGNEKT